MFRDRHVHYSRRLPLLAQASRFSQRLLPYMRAGMQGCGNSDFRCCTFSGFRFCPSVCGSIGGAPFARKTPTQAPEPGDHSSGRPCWCLHFFLRSSGVHPSLRMRWRYTGYSASLGPSRPVSYYGICSARPKNRHCDTCGRPFSQRPTQSAHFAPLRWPRGRGGPAQVATL